MCLKLHRKARTSRSSKCVYASNRGTGTCECGVELPVSVKCGNFLTGGGSLACREGLCTIVIR